MTFEEICAKAMKDWMPDLDKTGNPYKTYCNLGVDQITTDYVGYSGFKGMMANQIFDFMTTPKGRLYWRRIDGLEAFTYAMLKRLCIAVLKLPEHGHIAVIHPEPLFFSPSWMKKVPSVANIGKWNKVKPISYAFPTEPQYYLYDPIPVPDASGKTATA